MLNKGDIVALCLTRGSKEKDHLGKIEQVFSDSASCVVFASALPDVSFLGQHIMVKLSRKPATEDEINRIKAGPPKEGMDDNHVAKAIAETFAIPDKWLKLARELRQVGVTEEQLHRVIGNYIPNIPSPEKTRLSNYFRNLERGVTV
jgi:hypothetical protein